MPTTWSFGKESCRVPPRVLLLLNAAFVLVACVWTDWPCMGELVAQIQTIIWTTHLHQPHWDVHKVSFWPVKPYKENHKGHGHGSLGNPSCPNLFFSNTP